MKINIYSFLILIGLILINKIEASGPAAHVYYANLWLKKYENEDPQSFLIGNLFPDIRYMGKIDRKDTHELNVTVEKILISKSAFESGTLLHAFIDEKREEFILSQTIYEEIEEYAEGFPATFLKFLEDEILIEKIDTNLIIKDLDKILHEELHYSMDQNTIKDWHTYLKSYFVVGPSGTLKMLSFRSLKEIPQATLNRWCQIIPLLACEMRWILYVNDLTRFLETNFE